MPFEISFEMLPAGYVISVPTEQTVMVQMMEFTSSEDGQHFTDRLEGIPNDIVTRLPATANIHPSGINNLLAIIRRDKTCTVYVNEEVHLVAAVQTKRGFVSKGEMVFKDDIADIVRASIEGVRIPQDCGIVLIFSAGWRKGLFYDLEPLRAGGAPRTFEIEAVFGQYLAELMFQELFRITQEQWELFFAQQWFPFRCLTSEHLRGMIELVKVNSPVDGLMSQIIPHLKAHAKAYLNHWESIAAFHEHIVLLRTAVERFQADDYVSATAILFPRIEGILRGLHAATGNSGRATQENLSASAVSTARANRHSRCPLLQEKFERYLFDVYFADFSPNDTKIEISRNSVAHGVASAASFSPKAAAIGIMIVQQLYYYVQSGGVILKS
jgi:hypothetical protein